MATLASISVDITANTAGVERGFAQTNALLNQLVANSGAANTSFGHLTSSFAAGTVVAHAFMGAVQGVAGAVVDAAKGTLTLASQLEQAKIGFTTMLGGAQQADKFIGQLQQKAESTAFTFPGIQQIAQNLLAMGMAAKDVIPTIDAMSNALAAAGKGGDAQSLQRIGASLAEITAQGRITGEQLRELARNGIPVMKMLTEGYGLSAAKIREMSEAGQLDAEKFFKIFKEYSAANYGDIQAKQAKTWAVAVSNLGDIIGRLATQNLVELTEAATAGALAMNEFLHSDRALQWAADMKASISAVMTALQPVGAMLMATMGLKPAGTMTMTTRDQAKLNPESFGPDPADLEQAFTVPENAIKSVTDWKAEIADADLKIHGVERTLSGIASQRMTIKFQIEDIKADFEARLDALKSKQDALTVSVDQTKAHYEAILEPLNRAQMLLGRLAEDTKADFATIMDPLKAGLDRVNRQIEDSKTGYEALVRPIQAQITAINKANAALTKQRGLETQLADLKLRQKVLNAAGDPAAQGEIARRLKLNEYAQQELDWKIEALEFANKKGEKDKQIERLQRQANGLQLEANNLDRQSLGLIDKNAMAEAAGQAVVNDALKEKNALAQGYQDIQADAARAPLEAQLEQLEAQYKAVLDPLQAAQALLTRQIQDTAAAESAALKPIIEAQQELARRIQDVNQSQLDALKPLEAQQKALSALIKETEIARDAALAPYQAQEAALQRRVDILGQEKSGWDLIKTAAGDAIKDIEEKAKEAAEKRAEALREAAKGGAGALSNDPSVPPALAGTNMVSPESIANIEAFATSLGKLNTQVGDFVNAGHMTTLTNSVLVLGTVLAGLAIVNGLAGVGLGIAGLISRVAAIATGFGMLSGAASVLGAAIAGVSAPVWATGLVIAAFVAGLLAYVTNFNGFRDTVNETFRNIWETTVKVFQDMGTNINGAVEIMLRDSRQGGSNPFPQMGEWFSKWPGAIGAAKDAVIAVFTGMGANIKGAVDLMLKDSREGGSNPFPGLLAAFEGFKDLVGPVVTGIVRVFNPLATALNNIADALSRIPGSLPRWMTSQIPGLSGRGGGGSFSLPGGGGSQRGPDLIANNVGQNQIGLSPNDAAAACGPYAAMLFYNSIGRYPTGAEAMELGRAAGWTPGQGMGGTANFIKMLDMSGINAALDTTPTVGEGTAALQSGSPLAFSTPNHYFAATGVNQQGQFNVGGSGSLFAGGSEFMTIEEMTAIGGGMHGLISIVGQYGDAVQLASAKSNTALAGIMAPIQTAGVGMAQSLAQGIGQGDAVVANAVEAIVDAAIKNGIDPLHLLAIAKQESGFDPSSRNTTSREDSVGLFQHNMMGGQGQGFSAEQLSNASFSANKFAADHAALYQRLKASGLAGEELVTTFGRLAEGSDPQHAHKYGEAYQALVTKFGASTTAGLTFGAAQQTQAKDLQYNAQWVQTMATEQAALAQVLTGQVDPAMISTKTAMANFGAVLGPIERQVAGGAISLDTLQFKLVDLARATGVATQPFADMSAGLITQEEAMRRVINAAADVNPQYDALRQVVNGANPDMAKATLDFLQMGLNLGKVVTVGPAAVSTLGAVNSAVTPLIGTASGAAGAVATNVTSLTSDFQKLKPEIDRAKDSLRDYTNYLFELTPERINEQRDAWIDLHKAAKEFGDYLDSHTFTVKADIPEAFQSNSPPPLQVALEGIMGALDDLDGRTVRPLQMPSTAAAVRSVAERGGGGESRGGDTYHFTFPNYVGSKEELIETVHSGLLVKKRRNARLGLGDND